MGHRVLDCANGVTALDITRAQKPDLIICDLVMPIINGVDFVHRLRADPSIARVPVVFYTAAFRVEEVQSLAKSCGVNDVLVKSAEPQLILETVNKILSVSAHAPVSEPALLPQNDGKTKKVSTIRSRLVLLAMACVLPASLIAAVSISYDYQRNRDQAVHDAIATARALMHAVDRDLAATESTLRALATSPYLATNNLAAFYRQAQEVLRDHPTDNIVLSDASGQQRINTFQPFGQPLPKHNDLAQIQRTFETGETTISDLFFGRTTGKPFVRVNVPVRHADRIIYDIGMGISPERLSKILVRQHLPPDWIGGIFDSTGTIVARTRDMERFIGKKGSPPLVKRMTEIDEDAIESTTLEGIPVLSVFSRSTVSNWSVAIGIPRKALTKTLSYSLWWIVLATVILLVVSLGLAWAVGGRITRALHALTAPALALGLGEKITVPPLHLKEADEIGNALVRASLMLHLVQHQATHDVLTGLPNRLLFTEFVHQQLSICHRTGAPLSVLYFDLDGFKPVNDRHGHATGDELLHAVATRFKASMRASDIAARLGGDEFAAILVDSGLEDAAMIAATLVEKLSAPYQLGSLTIEISVSIGVAAYPESAATAETLFERADDAMYEAKMQGKRRYVVAS